MWMDINPAVGLKIIQTPLEMFPQRHSAAMLKSINVSMNLSIA